MKPDGRTKILDAALTVIRTKGYEARRVEDVCAETVGGFVKKFEGTERPGVEADPRLPCRRSGR